MGCYTWYSEEGTGRGRSPPMPHIVIAVPKCQCTNFVLFDLAVTIIAFGD